MSERPPPRPRPPASLPPRISVRPTAQPPSPEPTGIFSSVTMIGQTVATSLPPTFLGLVALNVVFLALLFWFLRYEVDQRTQILLQVAHSLTPCNR
jgi:hypothetical protein